MRHASELPDGRDRLSENIALIRAYTEANEDLRRAHHFLYDLRCPPTDTPTYVVMGINPGETDSDWVKSPDRTEETSAYDFHVHKGTGRSAISWAKQAARILDDAPYVQTEVFFWSSKDLGPQFRQRFGPLKSSKHLGFCTVLNEQLIQAYQPKAVVLPGVTATDLAASLFELRHVETVRSARERLVEHYTDGKRPWVITKHWTGARLSTDERNLIRDYIRAVS